jgi:hypothetical protein
VSHARKVKKVMAAVEPELKALGEGGAVEEQVMLVSETSILTGSDVVLDSYARTNQENIEVTPTPLPQKSRR